MTSIKSLAVGGFLLSLGILALFGGCSTSNSPTNPNNTGGGGNPSPTPTSSACVSCSPTPTPPCSPQSAGSTVLGPYTMLVANSGGTIVGYAAKRITLTQPSNVQAVYVGMSQYNYNTDSMKVLLYSDNGSGPGTLMGQSSYWPVPASQYLFAYIPLAVSLPPGDYWVFEVSDQVFMATYSAGGGSDCLSGSLTITVNPPSTYPGGGSNPGIEYSMYIAYCPVTLTATPTPSSPTPTPSFTDSPTITPTPTITDTPTDTNTFPPAITFTFTPTDSPTMTPTDSSSDTPTSTPAITNTPTLTPTNSPTASPTATPTHSATNSPSDTPTVTPTNTITPAFTLSPTPTYSFVYWNSLPPLTPSACTGVAVTVNGPVSYVYISETSHNRLWAMSPSLGGLYEFNVSGGAGTTVGGFSAPMGLALDGSGHLYECDNGNARVQQMSMATTTWTVISAPSGGVTAGCFYLPWGAATDAGGNLWVTDPGYSGVGTTLMLQKYTPGTGWSCPTSYIGNYAQGLCVDNSGNIYVADGIDNGVYKYNGSSWSLFLGGGVTGSANGQFDDPSDVKMDEFGRLLVSDYINNRVQVFDATTGAYLTKNTGQPGSYINHPSMLATSTGGYLYITMDAFKANALYQYTP